MEELIKRIISLRIEERRQFAKIVRSNKSIWNAVFGLGNTVENLEEGRLEGLVREENRLLSEVVVKAYLVEPKAAEREIVEAKRIVTEPNLKLETTASLETLETTETSNVLVQQTVTDEGGYYKLNLPVGNYNLVFERAGNVIATIKDVMIVTGHTDTRNAQL